MSVVNVEADDQCNLCWETIRGGLTYFAPPCKHLFCPRCMKHPRLLECSRCTVAFCSYVKVVPRVTIEIEEEENGDNGVEKSNDRDENEKGVSGDSEIVAVWTGEGGDDEIMAVWDGEEDDGEIISVWN